MWLKFHARKSIRLFILLLLSVYFALVSSQFIELFFFIFKFTEIRVDQFRLKTNKLNFIHFLSIRCMTVYSILHAPCVMVNFMRQSKTTIESTMHKHMFDPNNVYAYWAIDHQIEFEWCGSHVWIANNNYYGKCAANSTSTEIDLNQCQWIEQMNPQRRLWIDLKIVLIK